jgi:hypothetical protein
MGPSEPRRSQGDAVVASVGRGRQCAKAGHGFDKGEGTLGKGGGEAPWHPGGRGGLLPHGNKNQKYGPKEEATRGAQGGRGDGETPGKAGRLAS